MTTSTFNDTNSSEHTSPPLFTTGLLSQADRQARPSTTEIIRNRDMAPKVVLAPHGGNTHR
ncbi:hypothetical protein DB31_2757 [Hyalangium minutum]|uniref:Uncharacterized protein n=1 Tax=Hyalangium minutum TaxID=394096 RepID=A0A085W651_9BACT|nr:hypothetical protein DB31_2757 [Hyalangium minutum]